MTVENVARFNLIHEIEIHDNFIINVTISFS